MRQVFDHRNHHEIKPSNLQRVKNASSSNAGEEGTHGEWGGWANNPRPAGVGMHKVERYLAGHAEVTGSRQSARLDTCRVLAGKRSRSGTPWARSVPIMLARGSLSDTQEWGHLPYFIGHPLPAGAYSNTVPLRSGKDKKRGEKDHIYCGSTIVKLR